MKQCRDSFNSRRNLFRNWGEAAWNSCLRQLRRDQVSLLQSKPAALMTFRKEEGPALGRFLRCFLSEARDTSQERRQESFSSELVALTQTGNVGNVEELFFAEGMWHCKNFQHNHIVELWPSSLSLSWSIPYNSCNHLKFFPAQVRLLDAVTTKEPCPVPAGLQGEPAGSGPSAAAGHCGAAPKRRQLRPFPLPLQLRDRFPACFL